MALTPLIAGFLYKSGGSLKPLIAGLAKQNGSLRPVIGGMVNTVGGGSASDTSLSVFTVDGQPTVDQGTVELGSEFIGMDVNAVEALCVITPTNPAATVVSFTIMSDPLAEGSNTLSFTVIAENGVTQQEYSVTLNVAAPVSVAVDMVVNFSDGTGALTATKLNNGTHGNYGGGTWAENSAILTSTIEDHAVKLPFDLDIGGTLYGGPNGIQGNGLTFDFAGAPTTFDEFIYSLVAARSNCVAMLLLQTNTVFGSADYFNDTISIASTSYCVPQLRTTVVGHSVVPHSEGDLGRTIVVDPATWLLVSAFHDVAGQGAHVIVQEVVDSGGGNWALGDVVGAGYSGPVGAPFGEVEYIKLQSYLRGANQGTGNIKVKLAAFVESTTWPPYPLTVPAPTDVAAEQDGVDPEVILTWTSGMQIFKIERNKNGAGWTTLESAYDDNGVGEYTDTDLAEGNTAIYRVTAIIGSAQSSAAESNEVTVVVPEWTENVASGAMDSNYDVLDSAFGRVTPITLPAGDLSGLGCYIRAHSSNTPCKLSLYDPSDNLVASGTTADATGVGWLDVTFAPVTISGGAYKVFMRGNGNADNISWGGLSGQPANTSWFNFDTAYAGAAPVTTPANQGSITAIIGVRALIAT